MNTCTDHISIETIDGSSQLYPLAVQSIIDLQILVPSALSCVNQSLTYASYIQVYTKVTSAWTATYVCMHVWNS